MKYKRDLKTVRLAERETRLISRFLQENPAIENFSALARLAILDFISKSGSIPLRPIVEEEPKARPSFLWDYDLTFGQIREILAGPLEKRKWLVARILEHAGFNEVFRYLTPREIERDLPHIRLPQKLKDHWEYAIRRWRRAA